MKNPIKKIITTGWVPDECIKEFESVFEIRCPKKGEPNFTLEQVSDMIGDYDALFTMKSFRCDKAIMDKGVNLKAVGNHGVGYDNVDVAYATEKGLYVLHTPISVCEATAEFGVALIMSVTRGIVRYDKDLRETKVCKSGSFDDKDMLLLGKTLGILGFGRIGKAVARKSLGLGMKIAYYDVVKASPEDEKALNATYMPLDEILKIADVVTCHMPLTEETNGLVNKDFFKKMKNSAYFVNLARGKVMCEQDLVEALKSKEIRAAATDVFEFEPKVSEEITKLDNVVITPHVASCVYEARVNMAMEILNGMKTLSGGSHPSNIVNKELCK